jgi:hypothetical protein
MKINMNIRISHSPMVLCYKYENEIYCQSFNMKIETANFSKHGEISGSYGGMKMTIFWHVAQCSLIEIDQHFRGAYYLHHQDDWRQ